MFARIPLIVRLAAGAGGAGLLALGALGTSTPVLAAATPGNHSTQKHPDARQDRREVRRVVFEAEASVLGVKPEQLRAGLRQGQTVAQLAQAKGMDEQQFGKAVAAAAKPGLDRLVAEHKISADQAKRVEDRLSSGHVPFWNGIRHKKS